MKDKESWFSLVTAICWTLAAAIDAAGIIWALPTIAPLPVLVLGLCVANAFVNWSLFFRRRKGTK